MGLAVGCLRRPILPIAEVAVRPRRLKLAIATSHAPCLVAVFWPPHFGTYLASGDDEAQAPGDAPDNSRCAVLRRCRLAAMTEIRVRARYGS